MAMKERHSKGLKMDPPSDFCPLLEIFSFRE
jgi:hypothetical protein